MGFATVFSCKKSVEDRIIGTWTSTTTITYPVIFDEAPDVETETITFNEDGTGAGSDMGAFTWTADGDEATMTLTGDDELIVVNFDVTTNEKEHQVWDGTVTMTEDGVSFSIGVKFDMKK